MVVLTAETCWAWNEYWIYNKISGIKLVSLYSTIKMMHGPINIRLPKMFIVFRTKWRYSAPVLIKLEVSRPIFEKESNTEFDENPSSQGRVVPCRQTEERIVMKKPTVVLRNFVNATKHFRNLWTNVRLWASEQDSDRNSRICASHSGNSVHHSTPIPATITANFRIFSQNLQVNARKIDWAQVIPLFPFIDCLLVLKVHRQKFRQRP